MRMRFAANVLVMAVLGVAMPIGASFGQQGDAASNSPTEALKAFLRSYLNPGPVRLGPLDLEETAQITVVSVKTEYKAG